MINSKSLSLFRVAGTVVLGTVTIHSSGMIQALDVFVSTIRVQAFSQFELCSTKLVIVLVE